MDKYFNKATTVIPITTEIAAILHGIKLQYLDSALIACISLHVGLP